MNGCRKQWMLMTVTWLVPVRLDRKLHLGCHLQKSGKNCYSLDAFYGPILIKSFRLGKVYCFISEFSS